MINFLRFYERIVLSFVVFYSVGLNAPFVRGMLAWLVCFATLVLDIEYGSVSVF